MTESSIKSKQCVLVTGGTGYIGSHTCVALTLAGYEVILLDNLSNSSAQVLERLETILGHKPHFIKADIRDRAKLDEVFSEHSISSVIHFAGLKAVGESVDKPLEYYDNNVRGTIDLLQAMDQAGVHCMVFSSSATVYGDPASVPIREDFNLSVTNPYGRSKLMIEEVLADLYKAKPNWTIARLRYFNPVGAHESGLIGESPRGTPNNLLPYVSQVAVGRREQLGVYGNDYPTVDGTGVRDYIHVMDLAEGHVAALRYCEAHSGEMVTTNLGTGNGTSVLQMIAAFERASGRAIPYRILSRRPGDIAECWADPSLAWRLFGWKAQRNVDQMCSDAWRWQQGTPEGFV